MKITVIGVGAIGSVLAGFLSASGNDVYGIRRSKMFVDKINRDGLIIDGPRTKKKIKINAKQTVEDIGTCDLVIIATKAHHIEYVLSDIGYIVGKNTVIMTIQNGLGSAEYVSKNINSKNIIVGVAEGFGASEITLGHVKLVSNKLLSLGTLNNIKIKQTELIGKLLINSGFNVKICKDVNQMIWDKFICNVAFSGVSALTNKTMGEIISNKIVREIGLACGIEAYRLGVRKGIKFSFKDPVKRIMQYGKSFPKAKSSMLIDHLLKRKSEIKVLNGAVPDIAHDIGEKAPYNSVISALVEVKEKDYI